MPNLANGGLLVSIAAGVIVTDVADYSGTYLFAEGSEPSQLSTGLFWFMNVADGCLYYSDQKEKHRLFRYDLANRDQQLLLNRPVYGLTYANENLYYIDEEDLGLYQCATVGTKLTKVVNEPVRCFTLARNRLWYVTMAGQLKTYHLETARQSTVIPADAHILMVLDSKIIFAEPKQQGQLSIYNLENQQLTTVAEVSANSVNTDGQFLYCANRQDGRSIYRVEPNSGSTIRICGEQADYVHILKQELYFSNLGAKGYWYKVSLAGGPATKLGY